jgi:two-component system response regulator FlrC
LNSRPLDILPLANMMIEKCTRSGASRPSLSEAAEEKLLSHSWPGNVRELDNVIQRSLILMAGDEIEAEQIIFESNTGQTLSHDNFARAQVKTENQNVSGTDSLGEDLKSRETGLILEVLSSVKGSRKDAAEKLGISPRTLRYKLARLREEGIELPA